MFSSKSICSIAIDVDRKHLVFGFVRQNGTVHEDALIHFLCLYFYGFCEMEQFGVHGDLMTVSEMKDVVHFQRNDGDFMEFEKYNNGNHVNSLYGTIHCESPYVYEWTLKILKTQKGHNIVIGIDSSTENDKVLNEDFSDIEGGNRGGWMEVMEVNAYFAYSSRGRKYWNQWDGALEYGMEYGQGDTVRMVLDTADCTLEFYVNDQSQGIAFRNVALNSHTHLAVAMDGRADAIQLLGFEMRLKSKLSVNGQKCIT